MNDIPAQINLLDFVSKTKLHDVCEIAKSNLSTAQIKMKTWYDRKSRTRSFNAGDKVLILLPMSGNCLKAKFHGPYEIQRQINDLNYSVKTPDRMRKTRLCHINMIKEYRDRKKRVKQPVAPFLINVTSEEGTTDNHDQNVDKFVEDRLGNGTKLQNSDVLTNLDSKLAHFHSYQRDELKLLLSKYAHLFPDNPTRTSMVYHDVDVGESKPIKQYPYRLNPVKMKHFHRELQYMLENDIVEPSKSPWSSPSILVPKPDGSYRLCTDYRKGNSMTTSDSYPIP